MGTLLINGNPLEVVCKTGEVSDGYHTFDELYEHRCLLFCWILTMASEPEQWKIATWKSRKHSDGSAFEGW